MFSFKKKNNQYIKADSLLSIIMPVYNHELYVGEAIESVLNQTYSNFEFIIIDDGSRDSSVQVIQKYTDKRIIFIPQENRGAHNAINRGLEMAKGDYIAILNSDDVFEKNRFEELICEMHKNPELGFICSYITVIDDKGKKLGVKEGWKNMEPWLPEHPELTYQKTNDFKKNLLMWNFTSTTSNFLFSRSVYDQIGGMRNLHFAHDWDFALRAARVTQCKILEKPLMRYRVHQTNTISTNRKWMIFEILWMWAVHFEDFYDSLIFPNENNENDLVLLAESINTQGNDKVLWMLQAYLNSKKNKGIKNPEEILLENESLRNKFIDYIFE